LEAIALSNLGANQIAMNDLEAGRKTLLRTLDRVREIGDRSIEPNTNEGLAWGAIRGGDEATARKYLWLAVRGMREQSVPPLTPIPLFAVLEARSGRHAAALEMIGMARAQKSLVLSSLEFYLHFHMDEIRGGLPQAEVDAALARGATMRLEDVLRELESLEGAAPTQV
jgi:hypothetical protein